MMKKTTNERNHGNKASSLTSNREKILIAAARLIQEDGVAAASLSTIAKAAEIAKGTLHYYYHSKSDLLFDLAERQASEFSRRFMELAVSPETDRNKSEMLRQIVADILSQGSNSILIHLMLEGATGNNELNIRFKKLYQDLSQTIKKGFLYIYPIPVTSEIADIILSGLIGLLFVTVTGNTIINPDTFIRFIKQGMEQQVKKQS